MNITEELKKYKIKKQDLQLKLQTDLAELHNQLKKALDPYIKIKVGDMFTYIKEHGYTRQGETITVKVIEITLDDEGLVKAKSISKLINGKWSNKKELLCLMSVADTNRKRIYTVNGEELTKIAEYE